MSKINYFFEEIKMFKYGLPPKKWVQLCLMKENWEIGTLNFIFCSDKYLQNINRKYLKKSYFTDVISFKQEIPSFIKTSNNRIISGDIFISVVRVKENQKLYKTIFGKELGRVMIHGVLHLIGFNDSSPDQKLIMKKKENVYIDLM